MLFLHYAMYLFLGSVCLVRGAPVMHPPGKQPQDVRSSSWTSNLHGTSSSSSSSSSLNPTFRRHSTFQKIHITNTNTNPNPNPKSSSLFSPSFLTSPSYSISQHPSSSPYSWPRKIYGFFVNHARQHIPVLTSSASSSSNTHQHSIIGSPWLPDKKKHGSGPATSGQKQMPGVYALIRHLRRTDRVWAPVAILFAMSCLAVVAMGVVECIGVCWERGMVKKGRRRYEGLDERVLFDGGFLEDVVIEAVPVDDDEEDEGKGEDEVAKDSYRMLKEV